MDEAVFAFGSQETRVEEARVKEVLCLEKGALLLTGLSCFIGS